MNKIEIKKWANRLSDLVDLMFYQRQIGVNSVNYLLNGSDSMLKGEDLSMLRVIFILSKIRDLKKADIVFTREELISLFQSFTKIEKEKGFKLCYVIDLQEDFLYLKNTLSSSASDLLTESYKKDFKLSLNFGLKPFYVIKSENLEKGISYKEVGGRNGQRFYEENLDKFMDFLQKKPHSFFPFRRLDFSNGKRFICSNIAEVKNLDWVNVITEPNNKDALLSCFVVLKKETFNYVLSLVKDGKLNKINRVKALKKIKTESKCLPANKISEEFYPVYLLDDLFKTKECLKLIKEVTEENSIYLVKTLSEEDLMFYLSNKVVGLPGRKDLDTLIKDSIIRIDYKNKGKHYSFKMIEALFSRLKTPLKLFHYREKSLFERKGFLEFIETTDASHFYEILKNNKSAISTSYMELCNRINYRGIYGQIENVNFREQVDLLTKEEKNKIAAHILKTEEEMENLSFYEDKNIRLKKLSDFCSVEDLEMLELNYAELNYGAYEFFVKEEGKPNKGVYSFKDLEVFLEEIMSFGLLENFSIQEYLVENFQIISKIR